MINWGIIGLGRMANRFASAMGEVKNSKLLGIASNNSGRLKDFGEQYNIENNFKFNNYDEILSCNEINSIYISTLNNTHADIVIKAAKAKKNILCEKPVTTNYLDTIKVFEEFNKSDVFFLEAIAYRTHPQTSFVIDKIIKGEKNGYEARVLQHEIDHLSGKVFVDYLSSLKRNMIIKRVQKLQKKGEI